MMNPMSRFKFVPACDKDPEDMPMEGRTLKEVLEFNATGKYNVEARVTEFKVDVYEACPKGYTGSGGLFCGRRLPPNTQKCEGCGKRANPPLKKMFVRIELQDLKTYNTKTCTMFNKEAERFLGMGPEKYTEMENKHPEKLAKLLEEKIGACMIFHIEVKPPKDPKYNGLDWTIRNFAYLPQKGKEGEDTKDDGKDREEEEDKEAELKKKIVKIEKKEDKDEEDEDEAKKKPEKKKRGAKEEEDEEEGEEISPKAKKGKKN